MDQLTTGLIETLSFSSLQSDISFDTFSFSQFYHSPTSNMAITRGTAGKEKDDAAGKEKEDVATDAKSPLKIPKLAPRKKSTQKARSKSQFLPTAANAPASAPQPKKLRRKTKYKTAEGKKTAEAEPQKKKTKINVRHDMYEDPPINRFLHNTSVELEEIVAKCSTRALTSNEDDTTKSVSTPVSPKKNLPILSKSCKLYNINFLFSFENFSL